MNAKEKKPMGLKELTERTLDLLGVSRPENLGDSLTAVVKANNTDAYAKFADMVGNDLSVDWLQMIFQYYCAERQDKKQDYTPKCLAEFIGKLSGEADVVTDMCAGSGALTIQAWSLNHDQRFCLYEFDRNVIPFLLFNMALRNIDCTIYHADVLQQQTFHQYRISKGERFGNFKEVKP